jgi:hypothetical protein
MATPSAPTNATDGANTGEAEYEDPLLTFHHVRTASVILPSGARVRRKISLMSTYDENPFEEDDDTPLLDPGGTAGSSYSSIIPTLVDRDIQPWEVTRYDKFQIWLHSEGLKRYRLLSDCIEC